MELIFVFLFCVTVQYESY
ncbi:hypothetical protein LINPERPRIM_LOCUS22506 [Linum perenne]